jgi:hypothetical protein
MNKFTIKQFSEKIGQDYMVTSNLVKFMVNKGLAKEVGKVVAEGQRGKSPSIFEIPDKLEISF